MPHFKTFEIPHNSNYKDILVNTTASTWLFDCNTGICGTNFRFPSFGDHPKSLKFILRNYTAVDSLFVSHSDSIGPLFLKNTKIYLTKPVYEQILLKYEEYKSLLLCYDEENYDVLEDNHLIQNMSSNGSSTSTLVNFSIKVKNENNHLNDNPRCKKLKAKQEKQKKYKIVSLDEANVTNFKRNVIFIKYNQIVSLEKYSIQSRPCGTYIGWCYYNFTFPDTKSISIVTSYSSKRRFSTEAFPIDSEYLILNRKPFAEEHHSISDLTKFLRNYARGNRPLLIPTEFQTFFIEILLHTLSVIEPLGIPVSVFSPIFNKLDTLLNVQSEWLNHDFFTISEPFPVQKYSKFKVLTTLNDLDSTKNIVFCSYAFFDLNYRTLSEKFDILLINSPADRLDITGKDKSLAKNNTNNGFCFNENDILLPGLNYRSSTEEFDVFNVKIESLDKEIMEKYPGSIKKHRSFFIEGDVSRDYILVNSNLSVFDRKIFLSGNLINSDFENPSMVVRILKDEKPQLKQYLEDEIPILFEGWYYLKGKGIKFRIKDERIEYDNI